MMKKKKNFFVENYSRCWKFFTESRWHIVFSLGIFSSFFILGFAFPLFFREEIINFILELTKLLEGKSILELIFFIFLNNLKASFFAMVLGISFGIFPLITVMVNGYLLGFIARRVVNAEGILILWRLLPHGIFELPAVLFSIGIGFKIGFDIFKPNRGEKLKYNFREAIRFFVFVIFPLLVVAAIIEGILVGLGV